MLSFAEFNEKTDDEVLEALNMAQRLKAKQTFRKNKSKIAMGRKRAERRFADKDRLDKRAQRQARREVEKKILKDKSKSDLSFGQRKNLEKMVDKRKPLIQRLARKLKPIVKKKDREKISSRRNDNAN